MNGRNRVLVPFWNGPLKTCTGVTYVTSTETTKPVRAKRTYMRAAQHYVFLDNMNSKMEGSPEWSTPSDNIVLMKDYLSNEYSPAEKTLSIGNSIRNGHAASQYNNHLKECHSHSTTTGNRFLWWGYLNKQGFVQIKHFHHWCVTSVVEKTKLLSRNGQQETAVITSETCQTTNHVRTWRIFSGSNTIGAPESEFLEPTYTIRVPPEP